MENKGNSRKCSGCRYYQAFYVKGASAFYRERLGYCDEKKKVAEAKECCELYKRRGNKDRTITLEYLESVIADLEELKLYLQVDFSM